MSVSLRIKGAQVGVSVVARSVRIALALVLTAVVSSVAMLPAAADVGRAELLTFSGVVNKAGVLSATQQLSFETAPETLEQRLATRAPIDSNRFYTYQISNVTATVDDAEVDVTTRQDGDYLVVSIPTKGASEAVLNYQVTGATRSQDDMTVFSWRPVQGLNVQVDATEGEVRLPAVAEFIDCTSGAPGTLDRCDLFVAGTHDAPSPLFQTSALGAGEQVTLTVGVTAEAVAATAVVEEEWSLNRAFRLTPLTVGIALGALAAGGIALYVLVRRVGVDLSHDGEVAAVASFQPVADGQSVFEVSDGIRPGHVGTVADERVDPVDVTATLLDLAVRGHLRIEELPHSQHELLDWRLSRTSTDDELAEFEQRLLDAVTPDGAETLVSELPDTLSPALPGIQDALYDDVVARGWFESRPDSIRSSWRTRGLLVMGLAAVVALALVAFTSFGLLAIVVVLLAAGLLWLADRMPRRTAAGSKLLSGLGALSAVLATQPTDHLPPGKEIQQTSHILPYTIVLGHKDRWLAALVAADDDDTAPDPTTISWYHAPETWHLQDLPTSLTQFIHIVQGELFSR
ncbi:MAG: DUF2207 domain-containing protein [Arachnia sp.]